MTQRGKHRLPDPGQHRAPGGRRSYRLTVAGTTAVVGLVLAGTGVADAATTATVGTGGGPLKVRSAPALTAPVVGTVANNSRLSILCQQNGARVVGKVRTTAAWDRLADGRYVSDGYVRRTGPAPATCAAPAPVAIATVTWAKPVTAPIWGGFRPPTRPMHDGDDLGALRGTPIGAAAAGTVVTAASNAQVASRTSSLSWRPPGVPAPATANGIITTAVAARAPRGTAITTRHADNTVTRYCHMIRRPLVSVGQVVALGQTLGFVGSSGNSGAPHLHFEVHTGYPATRANAVDPVPFMIAHGAPLG